MKAIAELSQVREKILQSQDKVKGKFYFESGQIDI